jgi:hypothetical protein
MGVGEAIVRPKRRGFDQCGLSRSQTVLLGALDHGTGPTIAFVNWRSRVRSRCQWLRQGDCKSHASGTFSSRILTIIYGSEIY